MGSRLRVASVRAPRPLALLIAPLLACVALAGCGGSSHKQAHHSGTSGTRTVTRTSGAIRPIAAVSDTAYPGPDKLRVAIYDVRRSGPFMTLDFGVTCESAPNPCGQLDFTASTTTAGEEAAQGGSAGGIRLIDPVGEKEYEPVLDAQGRPDSADLSNLAASPNITLGWVTFPAPPASVSTVDVLLPHGGPAIHNVPISSGPAPTPARVGPRVQAAGPAPFSAPAGGGTSGLTLPVKNLVLTVGNPNGSDAESGSQATLTLRTDVLFQFDKSNLTPKASAIVTDAAAKIKARATGPVQVTGYTDSIGTDAVNIPLSQARAQAVVSALRPLTPGVTYHAAGLGAADPVAPNTKSDGSDNPAGRALNRRVTIAFHAKAPAKPTPPPQSSSSTGTAAGSSASRSATYRPTTIGLGTSSYAVTIYHLFREGNLAVLELTFQCQSGPGSGSGCNTETNWAGTPTVPPLPADVAHGLQLAGTQVDSLSGVYLSDPATGAIYIPVADSARSALTTTLDSTVDPGTTVSAWIYYPAPTASSATIVLPGTAPQIRNVPIAASAP